MGWIIPLIGLLMIVSLAAAALASPAAKISLRVWAYGATLILAQMLLPASVLIQGGWERTSLLLAIAVMLARFLLPSLALVVVAALLLLGLKLNSERRSVATAAELAVARRIPVSATVSLALAALLLAETLYNLYWLLIWDQTYDAIDVFWLVVPVLAALTCGLALLLGLRGRARLAGLYGLLIPALLIGTLIAAKGVNFHRLTDERAAQVSRALDAYHARQGRYPQNLRELVPRYMLLQSGPVIIAGQGWCYDGGGDYYRLGYVDRAHWSDPLWVGRLASSGGAVPDLPPICADQTAAQRALYPNVYEERR